MADTTYNGWRNYETWRVNLEVLDDYVASMGICCKHAPDYQEPYEFSKTLEDYADQAITGFGEHEDGLAVDYARAFLSDVDYYEIATSQLADLPERCEDHPATCEECGEVLDEAGEYFRAGLCDDCGKESDVEPAGFVPDTDDSYDAEQEYAGIPFWRIAREEETVPDVDDRAHDAAIAANNAEDLPTCDSCGEVLTLEEDVNYRYCAECREKDTTDSR